MSDNKIDLTKPGIVKLVSTKILEDIDNHCAKVYDDGHRNHLGASLIGHNCSRYLWYVFRWVFHKEHSGRQQRLFNRGHREEERFVEWLRGVGFKVKEYDLDSKGFYWDENNNVYTDETEAFTHFEKLTYDSPDIVKHLEAAKGQGFEFQQLRISDCLGHFGGSLDGLIEFPESYGIEGEFLSEFKTNGTGAGFQKLLKEGVVLAKEQHFAQQSVYGKKRNLTHSVYLNICKNDDDLYVEFVPLNHTLGEQMIKKAERIIFMQTPPDKLSSDPANFNCKFCDMSENCHSGKQSEKNCRSCKNAIPIEQGQWGCNFYNQIIPKDFIKQGCDNWSDINV